MNPDRIDNIGLRIYTSADTKLSQAEIDAFAEKEIKTIANKNYD